MSHPVERIGPPRRAHQGGLRIAAPEDERGVLTPEEDLVTIDPVEWKVEWRREAEPERDVAGRAFLHCCNDREGRHRLVIPDRGHHPTCCRKVAENSAPSCGSALMAERVA